MTKFKKTGGCFADKWIVQGYFKFGDDVPEDQRCSKTIREGLDRLEGRHLVCRRHPKVLAYATTLYWGDGDAPYVEAQYVALLPVEVPVLLLGLSVEKGVGREYAETPAQQLERTWDWHRLKEMKPTTFQHRLVEIASTNKRDLFVQVWTHSWADGSRSVRAWVLDHESSTWCIRGEGTDVAGSVTEHLAELHGKDDTWVDLVIGHALSPREASEMTVEQATGTLHTFGRLRAFLRGRRAPRSS